MSKVTQSSLDAAPAALAEGLASYQQNPELYEIFTIEEVLGVPKKGLTDFIIKALTQTNEAYEILVPKVFLSKNNKLVIREMGVKGAKIAIRQKRATVERVVTEQGFPRKKTVIETYRIFVALLP